MGLVVDWTQQNRVYKLEERSAESTQTESQGEK